MVTDKLMLSPHCYYYLKVILSLSYPCFFLHGYGTCNLLKMISSLDLIKSLSLPLTQEV